MNYQTVLDFWFSAETQPYWFAKSDAFDQQLRNQFLDTLEQARQAELWSWRENAEGRLAEIIVLDSGARVFFLAKAEIESWPVLGNLAKGGGTLFIKRGSGDSIRIREQIAEFLTKDIPVLFFPEATTTDGTKVKKVHGRILGAAIEAKKPVQTCVICYVNKQGQLDNVVPFIGNETFVENVQGVLEMPKVTAHLKTFPAISTEGHTVESLTALVQQTMQQGLEDLQKEVLG